MTIIFLGGGGGWGARIREFFTKNPNQFAPSVFSKLGA